MISKNDDSINFPFIPHVGLPSAPFVHNALLAQATYERGRNNNKTTRVCSYMLAIDTNLFEFVTLPPRVMILSCEVHQLNLGSLTLIQGSFYLMISMLGFYNIGQHFRSNILCCVKP